MNLRKRETSGDNEAKHPSEKTWLQVPFSANFMFERARLLEPKFGYHKEQAHTRESIAYFYSDENEEKDKIERDLPRTLWLYGNHPDKKLYSLNKRGQLPGALSEDEARTVVAFSCTTNALEAEKPFQQGGCLHVGAAILYSWLLNFIIIQREQKMVITRKKNKPKVLIATNHEKGWRVDPHSVDLHRDEDNPDYFYNVATHIKEADENGKIRAVICDNNKEGLQVQEGFWQELLDAAYEKLPKLELKESELYKLADFIPFLCEEDFIPLFAEQLKQKASPEQVQQITQLIALCFDERYADLERIAEELEKQGIISHLKELAALKRACRDQQQERMITIEKELKAEGVSKEERARLLEELTEGEKLAQGWPTTNDCLNNALNMYKILEKLKACLNNREGSNLKNINDFYKVFYFLVNSKILRAEGQFWQNLRARVEEPLHELKDEETDAAELAVCLPFLGNEKLTARVVRQLAETLRPEQVEPLNHLIALHFEDHYSELEHIASELIENDIHSFLMEQTLLKKECQNYRNYLLEVMKKELQAGGSAAEDADEFIKMFVVSGKLPQACPQANVKLNNALDIYVFLGSLMTCFKNKESTNLQNIINFSELFNSEASKNIFEKGADSVGRKFLKAVGHILLSLVTLGVYALASAWQAKKKYNSYKFWKSPEAIHVDRIKELLPPPDSELRLIKP